MTTKKVKTYEWIRKWGHHMGSFNDYIEFEIAKAIEDDAPANAYSRRQDGTWDTTDSIIKPSTREALGLEPLESKTPTRGMKVKVYEDPHRREHFEGTATVVGIRETCNGLKPDGDQWWLLVYFDGKDESDVYRWVHVDDVNAAA